MRPALCHPESKYYAKDLCASCYAKAFRARQPDYWRAKNRESYYRHQDQRVAEVRRYQQSLGPEVRRQKHRIQQLKAYGLTPESFSAMLRAQREVCAVCGGTFTETPHIDHDPETGIVRGLTHRQCNVIVGFMEHPLRPKAESYLERSKT